MGVPKDIKAINDWLDKTYGHDLLGRAYYRLIWSEGLLEKRKGTFNEFYGRIFLRSFYGVKEQPKYLYHPNWREKWILERLDYTPNPELALDTAGHYEPLYAFYDEKGGYLKPTLAAIKFFMTKLFLRKPWKTDDEKRRDMEAMEKGEFDAEAEFFYGCLDDAYGADLASAIRNKEAVVNPGVLIKPDGGLHWFNRGTNGSNSGVVSTLPVRGHEAGAVSGTVHDSTSKG